MKPSQQCPFQVHQRAQKNKKIAVFKSFKQFISTLIALSTPSFSKITVQLSHEPVFLSKIFILIYPSGNQTLQFLVWTNIY